MQRTQRPQISTLDFSTHPNLYKTLLYTQLSVTVLCTPYVQDFGLEKPSHIQAYPQTPCPSICHYDSLQYLVFFGTINVNCYDIARTLCNWLSITEV